MSRVAMLTFAIAINISLLGYFKYVDFFIVNINNIFSIPLPLLGVILPLGISFFTFTQIAFLVDTFRHQAKEKDFIYYLLFVTYFPHLIAGPILHHAEMIPQFRNNFIYKFNFNNFCHGIVVFTIGLFKKIVLADGVSQFVGPVFDAAERGSNPSLFDAWGGALAYTFQLYFDFSGYCDMAIGLSWMIGIALPLNFNSPYKATNISDFWRRWHMTLSRFLRDYLYIPLGGNRRGMVRRYSNLLTTMVIGGLWHGAGWTFIVWGALHGAYLVTNHAWQAYQGHLGLRVPRRIGVVIAWVITFVAVIVGWVFFRAQSIGGAGRILGGMIGINGCALPGNWLGCVPIDLGTNGDTMTILSAGSVWIWCAVLLGIVLGLPNTQEIMRHCLSGITRPATVGWAPIRLSFHRSTTWAIAISVLLVAGLVSLQQPASFLYFNF